MFKQYTRKENLVVLTLIGVVLALVTLPAIAGYLLAGGNFLGGHYLNIGDIGVYISYIEQVKEGKIFVANLFTSEPQKDVFLTPLWLVLGFIARVFNLSGILIFILAKIILGFFFLVFIFYKFLDLFFKRFFDKIIAFILICFSSGLGLFFKPNLKELVFDEKFIFAHFPADLLMPEANTFLTLAHSGLFILSQLLIILIFYFFLKGVYKRQYLIYLFFLALLSGFIHTYDFFIIEGVLAVYFGAKLVLSSFLRQRNEIKEFLVKYLVTLLGFLPAIAYFFLVVKKEPALWGWVEQNITLSPSPVSYLIAFSFLIIFGLFSLGLKAKEMDEKLIFLLSWVLTIFFLIYSPLPFQRKLTNTLHIALAILATYSFVILVKGILTVNKKRYVNVIGIVLIFLFMSLSNFSFIFTAIYDYKKYPEYFYLPEKYYQAAAWLKNNSFSNDAILASARNGSFLPPLIARPVFLGHRHQTANLSLKKELLDNWFFKDNDQGEKKKEFLQNYNIKYIFYTDREKALGDYNLDKADFLQEVYNNEQVKIYKVK
jgi:hypothetical protein